MLPGAVPGRQNLDPYSPELTHDVTSAHGSAADEGV